MDMKPSGVTESPNSTLGNANDILVSNSAKFAQASSNEKNFSNDSVAPTSLEIASPGIQNMAAEPEVEVISLKSSIIAFH